MVESQTGRLILAAMPIGDPDDAPPRLRAALSGADVIAAEDTRRLRAFAARAGVQIGGRVISCYEHNEAARVAEIMALVREGATVVVVSDAGMPTVSDPGFRLVTAAIEAGLAVSAIPGPSAVLTALALSGLPTDRFCFEGFLPRKEGRRRAVLAELAAERRTMVFFEAPHRLAATLADMVQAFGADRPAAVCRELTKVHEEVRRETLAQLSDWAADGVLGEITVVVGGAPLAPEVALTDLVQLVRARHEAGMRLKDAAAEVASRHGVSVQALYQATLKS